MFLIKNLFTESTPINEEYDMVADLEQPKNECQAEDECHVAVPDPVTRPALIPYGNSLVEDAYAVSPFKHETVSFLGHNYPYVVARADFPKNTFTDEVTERFNLRFFEDTKSCNVFIIDSKEFHYYCAFINQIVPITIKYCGSYDVFASLFDVDELFADFFAAREINEDYLFFKIEYNRSQFNSSPTKIVIPVFTINRENTITDEQIAQLKNEYYYLDYSFNEPVLCSKQIKLPSCDYMFVQSEKNEIFKINVRDRDSYKNCTVLNNDSITETTYYNDYYDDTPFFSDCPMTEGLPSDSIAFNVVKKRIDNDVCPQAYYDYHNYKELDTQIAKDLAKPDTRAFHRKQLENMHNNDFETEYTETYNPKEPNTIEKTNFEREMFNVIAKSFEVDERLDAQLTERIRQYLIENPGPENNSGKIEQNIQAKVAHFDKMMNAATANERVPDEERFLSYNALADL
jgi:hypothetical protein